MSVAPKMLTERQQLAIALRESMTAAPARVATPGSAPRPAAHSPAGDEAEPHKRARKLSRVERELASLAPWAWDPLVGKHAPGNAMMRDFAEVAADKVVTTNTDTYDSYRFAAPADPTEEETDQKRARHADRRGDASKSVSKTSMPSNAIHSDPRKGLNKRRADKRSPVAKAEKTHASTPATATPAPATARKATPAAVSKKRATAAEDATPLSSTRDVAKKQSRVQFASRTGGLKRASKTTATETPKEGDEASPLAFGKKKTKPRSSLSVGKKAPRGASVGKNLVDALERAVEGTGGVAETETYKEGKENAPPDVGANVFGPGSGLGPGPVPGPAARAPRSARAPRQTPLADLGESRRHREAALLAVAAAEADAEAAASGPAMTPSQQLLQAYYDLTGSRTLPAAARLVKNRDENAAAERFYAHTEQAPPNAGVSAPESLVRAPLPRYAPPFLNPLRPVCVTVGPFESGFSLTSSYDKLPTNVVPLTASVARACEYLEKRDAAEARHRS